MSAKKYISLFRVPRTGSTMVRRALMVVAQYPAAQCGHEKFLALAPLVVTIRDWRDVLYSQWRIHFDHLTKTPTQGQITRCLELMDRRLADLDQMTTVHKSYFVWRYEDTYNNLAAVKDNLEHIIRRQLTVNEVCSLIEIVQVKRCLEVVRSIKAPAPGENGFSEFNSTGLHGNHIGPHRGQPGYWREGIPAQFHERINTHLKPALLKWGYQVEE